MIWLNLVILLLGLFIGIVGIIGNGGVLVYVGGALVVLNILPVYRYFRKKKTNTDEVDRG